MDTSKFSTPMNLTQVKLTGGFWKEKSELVRREVLPYQWNAINDRVPNAQPSYCLHNFRTAARVIKMRREGVPVPKQPLIFESWPKEGEDPGDRFWGFAFQDTDVYKWIEAASYSLTQYPDPELEALVDEAVGLIVSAQEEDGYLDTYFTINDPDARFTDLSRYHELYCFGHLTEAAAALFEATGKNTLLQAACRYAECISASFGPEPGKRRGVPGHEIAEMALARLYELTGNETYRKLGQFFIDERGQEPKYFAVEAETRGETPGASPWDTPGEDGERIPGSYSQSHLPVREQTEAVGHAVRAVYLYSGMADFARISNDNSLKNACDVLWDNIVQTKMYITGGIGGTEIGEAFSFNYDLPNDTIYAETCASVGMAFFARRMLSLDPDSRYADICERELYNGILSGIALDGKSFFYVNPLEVWPEASYRDTRKAHVFPTRRKWLACACCPPNLARLFTSLPSYAVTENENTLFVHQYMDLTTEKSLPEGLLTLKMKSEFPWNGRVTVQAESTSGEPVTVAFRLPGWCESPSLPAFSGEYTVREEKGYLYVTGIFRGETWIFDFPMEVRLFEADARVREDSGRIAVMRGPLVYCLEEVDNGPDLHLMRLSGDVKFGEKPAVIGTEAVTALTADGYRRRGAGSGEGELYRPYRKPEYETAGLTFIPYYAWANRGENEMTVWITEK